MQPKPAEPNVRLPVAATAILLAHAVAAIAWWRMAPHGFPGSHPRFWVNDVLPNALLVASAVGVWGVVRRQASLYVPALAAITGGWLAVALTACILFPMSAARFAAPLILVALSMTGLALAICQRHRLTQPRSLAGGALGAVIGAGVMFAQRAPEAATRPLNPPLPKMVSVDKSLSNHGLIELSETVRVQAATGRGIIRVGALTVDIGPCLTFESRSPDRFWTIFASRLQREGKHRRLLGAQRDDGGLWLAYADDAQHWLWAKSADDAVEFEAISDLPAPVYSHLNSFCQIDVQGHSDLRLVFSPCPTAPLEPLPADYPIGRPARAAYLDGAGVFHVVEASSGEKGPFRQLAAGPLSRNEPLAITVIDNAQPICRITLADWASQLDVALSPTAGWEARVNCIEFQRDSGAPTSAVHLWFTLAGTSLGRGWDSVGHRQGVYRNRVRVDFLQGKQDQALDEN